MNTAKCGKCSQSLANDLKWPWSSNWLCPKENSWSFYPTLHNYFYLTNSLSDISSSSMLIIGCCVVCGVAACIGELFAKIRLVPRKGETSGEEQSPIVCSNNKILVTKNLSIQNLQRPVKTKLKHYLWWYRSFAVSVIPLLLKDSAFTSSNMLSPLSVLL